jgi:hypothetical protein
LIRLRLQDGIDDIRREQREPKDPAHVRLFDPVDLRDFCD